MLRGSLLLSGAAGFLQLMLGSFPSALLVFAAVLVLYFATLAVHELAHFHAAHQLSARPKFSGWNVVSHPPHRADAIVISLAGPIAGATVPFTILAFHPLAPITLAAAVLSVNHLVNLLPVFPDGRIIVQNLKQGTTS